LEQKPEEEVRNRGGKGVALESLPLKCIAGGNAPVTRLRGEGVRQVHRQSQKVRGISHKKKKEKKRCTKGL